MKNNNIQRLRGVCALIVFLSHSLCMFNSSLISDIHRTPLWLLFDGQSVVLIFFALSGFFMDKNYHSMNMLKEGITKRLKRLYPVYFVTTILCYIVYSMHLDYEVGGVTSWGRRIWSKDLDLWDLFLQLCFIMDIKQTHLLINPVAWYMYREAIMMLVLPVLLYLNAKNRGDCFLIVCACIAFVIPPIDFMFPFLCGTILHRQIKKYLLQIKKIFKNRYYLITMLALGIFLYGIRNIIPGLRFSNLFITIGAMIFISYAYIKDDLQKEDLFSKFGNISYEFYLIHFAVLMFFRSYVTNIALYSFICFVISITIAKALSLMDEKLKNLL